VSNFIPVKIHIETQRLLIREICDEDVKGIFELDTDPEVHKYLGNKPITSMEQAAAVIKFIQRQYRENGIGRWAVIEKETNNFIGWTGLKLITETINNQINYYDLGYRFIRKYWGKGYATETANATLKYAFDTLQLNIIFAMADVKNAASNTILKKVGLQLLGIFDYDEVEYNWYKITKEEWTTTQKCIE
jgi:ribosomal-protein-alanine N-acetyltransferase